MRCGEAKPNVTTNLHVSHKVRLLFHAFRRRVQDVGNVLVAISRQELAFGFTLSCIATTICITKILQEFVSAAIGTQLVLRSASLRIRNQMNKPIRNRMHPTNLQFDKTMLSQ
jgi:hypothetical protein